MSLVMALLLTSLLCGCESTMIEIEGACAENAHCASGLACHQGFCVEGSENFIALRARVTPPPATGLLQQQIPSLPLGSGPNVTITLVEPAVLRGVVRHAGDGLAVNVPGELEARTSGDLPGMDYRFTTTSIDGLDDQDQGFELRLLPGRPYELVFRPEAKTLPPHCFALEAAQAVDGDFNIELPAKTDYVALEGFVRWSTYQAIGDARVTAMLEDGLGVPTVVTDAVAGKFTLRLPPDTMQVQLVVEAPVDGPVFPNFTTDWLAPSSDMAVDIPPLPPGLESFTTEIHVLAPGDAEGLSPAAGLNVTLLGSLAGGNLRRSVTTDMDGVARAEVLPGAYELLISVPPGQDYAGWSGATNLLAPDPANESSLPTLVVELAPRPYVVGTLVDANGSPVTSGKVVATRRATASSGGLTFAPQPFTCPLDANGRFVLRVDTGRYDLRLTPDQETGAPAVLVRDVEVAQDIELELEAPSPGVARLTVLDPQGAPLPDTTVELYLPSTLVETGGPQQSLLVKGTSDEDGSLDLLVPFEP